MKLYELRDEILDVLNDVADRDGEFTAEDEAKLDALNLGLEEKADSIAGYVRSLEAHAKALAEEEKRMADRRRALLNRAEDLRQYTLHCLDRVGVRKVEGRRFTVSMRTAPPSVDVLDESAIPADYVVTSTRPDKRAIKAALEAGETVPGAQLTGGKLTLTIR